MKNLLIFLILLLSIKSYGQLQYTIEIEFGAGESTMSNKDINKMTSKIDSIMNVFPNCFVSQIQSNSWEWNNIQGVQFPLCNQRGIEVLRELNRWGSVKGILPIDQSVINPASHIRSALENQKVIIYIDSFI